MAGPIRRKHNQKALRPALSVSPASRCAAKARSYSATLSSSCPVRYAARANRSRSSADRAASVSALRNPSRARGHSRARNAARAWSRTVDLPMSAPAIERRRHRLIVILRPRIRRNADVHAAHDGRMPARTIDTNRGTRSGVAARIASGRGRVIRPIARTSSSAWRSGRTMPAARTASSSSSTPASA